MRIAFSRMKGVQALRQGLCSFAIILGLLVFSGQSAWAHSILLINGAAGTSEPATTAAITTNFVTIATALGHSVTVSDPVPVSFAGFNQVWDFRFSNTFALTPAEQAAYAGYVAGGGGLFVMGENASFAARNTSVLALINALGGGSLTFVTPTSTQTVLPPFTGPFPIVANHITYDAPGGVGASGPGTGQFITTDGAGSGTAVAWQRGTLSAAPSGALAVIFDVNWAQGTVDAPDSQNLLRNIVGFVEREVDPPAVPEPSTVLLLGSGLLALMGYRRFGGK